MTYRLQPSFVFETQPCRVVFAAGATASLPTEIDLLGRRRVLVLATPDQVGAAETIGRMLDSRCVGVLPIAIAHVPIETAKIARREAGDRRVDCLVAIGGGSTIGLAKAIALESGIDIVAVPTTYAGSEMTPIWGITEDGQKRTGRDPRVRPRVVIYDVEQTVTLPIGLSVTSGLNAIAHCIEALYAPDGNPIISLVAEEGIAALSSGLARLLSDAAVEAREQCLYGAWLAGMSLGATSMGLHHKLCHILGGSWNLPHAETHAVLLPYACAYNAPAVPSAMQRIAQALGSETAPDGLWALARHLGTPRSLHEIGLPQAALDRVADLSVQNAYANPRPIARDAIRVMLQDAWRGDPPPASGYR